MGESVVEAPNNENKMMGETEPSKARLEVSVSFGKFDNVPLSWERFSTFSPNKYLEEVEKCATPGSVAEKKAYFEAHYKKIAAQKTEQPEKEKDEKKMETAEPKSDDQIHEQITENADEFEKRSDKFDCGILADAEMQGTCLMNSVENNVVDMLNGDVESNVECRDSSVEALKESSVDPEKPVESLIVDEEKDKEEIPSSESLDDKKLISTAESDASNAQKMNGNVNSDASNAQKINGNVKLDRSKELQKAKKSNKKEPQKVSPLNERNVAKKKPASPMTKVAKTPVVTTAKVSKPTTRTPLTSTPKALKPAATTAVKSASPSFAKATATSLTKREKTTSGQSKKVAPKSLHMSLSLGPSTPEPGPAPQPANAMRRSLIMEKMGDKDIVKRAFKTFQNSLGQIKFSGEGNSPVAKQTSTNGTQPKTSVSSTQKLNGGSMKVGGLDKKGAKAAPSPIGLQTDKKAERQKELVRKVERKSDGKSAEKDGVQLKLKVEKKGEITRTRQSLNVKNLGQRLTKSSLDKGDFKK